jgi:hypothetical protein
MRCSEITALVMFALAAGAAQAESIQDTLDIVFGSAGAQIGAVTSGTVNANRGTPAPANSIRYEYDVTSGLPRRVQGSLGPVFTRRASTLGKGRLAFMTAIIHEELDSLDGIDLLDGSLVLPVVTPFGTGTATVIANTSTTISANSFTYGVTDTLDIGIAVPIVHNDASFSVTTSVGPVSSTVIRANDATGIGDLLIDARWAFYDTRHTSLAAVMEIRAPTGDEEDFLGTGSWRVFPQLVASFRRDTLGAHVNFGVQASEKSNIKDELRYKAAVDWHVRSFVTLSAEVLGRYILDNDRLKIGSTAAAPKKAGDHQADAVVGAKFAVSDNTLIFGTAILTVDDNGLRSGLTAEAGIEISF